MPHSLINRHACAERREETIAAHRNGFPVWCERLDGRVHCSLTKKHTFFSWFNIYFAECCEKCDDGGPHGEFTVEN